MAKTQTKTEVRNAAARIGKMLRGIDNSAQVILRDKKKLDDKIAAVQKDVKVVQTLVSSVSSTALAAMSAAPAPAKPAAKPSAPKPNGAGQKAPAAKGGAQAKPKAAKPAAKPEKKPAAKPEKKPAAPKAAAKKPTPAKTPAKPAAQAKKIEPANRPPLKQVIAEVIRAKGPSTAPDIYKEAQARHGYWSRQSLYNALKDTKSFVKDGDKFRTASQDATESFIESVSGQQATAHVV